MPRPVDAIAQRGCLPAAEVGQPATTLGPGDDPAQAGVGVIPWSPLSSGLLGGVLGDSERSRRQSAQSLKRIDKLRPKLEQWEKLCADLGEEPAAVALAWLLAQDGVTCPIIGPRTLGQLDGASLRSLELTLTPDTLGAIDAVFPGPGGTAPEAYAW